MTTFLAQNQFNSVDGSPPSPTDTAVASSDLQPRATAELPSESTLDPATGVDTAAGPDFADHPVPAAVLIDEPTSSTGGRQETPASAPTKNPDAGVLGTEHIHEIFHWVRKLIAGQHPEFVLDEAAFMAEIEEVPLFIREDGYLRRQA